ncbi:MAG: hypothetical protein ACI4NM_09730 [Bullifex sp.]
MMDLFDILRMEIKKRCDYISDSGKNARYINGYVSALEWIYDLIDRLQENINEK